MSAQQYRLRHKLAVFVRSEESHDPFSPQIMNLELAVFIGADRTKFLPFNRMESLIQEATGRFTAAPLETMTPFDTMGVDLETIGVVLFQAVEHALTALPAPLERLEISEGPVRALLIQRMGDQGDLQIDGRTVNVRNLLLSDYVSGSTHQMTSSGIDQQGRLFVGPSLDSAVRSSALPAVDPVEAEEIPPEAFEGVGDADEEGNEEQKKKRVLPVVLALIVLALAGILLAVYLYYTGLYPSGADVYGHLFKSDLAYKSVQSGNYYPLYTELWYNGLQPYRYWAPLPYYLMAFLQFIAGGDVFMAYLLYVVFSVIVGGVGWLLWGIMYRRMVLGTFFALLWFFVPDNLRIFFVEGNLPRMTIAILLPYLFFFVWRLVEHRKKRSAVPIVVIMCLLNLCHIMIAAMVGIGMFVFLLLYSISRRRYSESLYTILFMLMSFAICGPWVYPALKGGLVAMDPSATAEVMRALSTPAATSLNPFLRGQGGHELFYFGVSLFVVALFGLFFSDRKSRPGFLTALLIFLGSLPELVPILEKLPLNQLFWMPRFAPIACAVFMISMFEWRTLRRYVLLLMAALLVFDSYLSLDFHRFHSMAPLSLSYSLDDAKRITDQRLTLMDQSTYGSYPSFGISAEEPATRYTFGWAWQGAATAYNIMMLNTALERGHYYYLFDRCLELGDDTVLVQKQQVREARQSLEALEEGAAASQYYLAQETNDLYIFKRETPKTFGVVTKYEGLAIGYSANLIALEYPIFEEGVEWALSEYTAEELKKYKVIYLSGFTYGEKGNKEEAEALIMEVAKAGVRIIIDMNLIPADSITRRMTFLEVNAQPVGLRERFPNLIYQGQIYEPLPFEKEDMDWSTIYLEGLDKIFAYTWLEDKLLPVSGSKWYDNLIFLGFNLLYHASQTDDEAVFGLLGNFFGFEDNQLPTRTVVPLTVDVGKNVISVRSPSDNANTTFGYQDIFTSDREFKNINHLVVVQRGLTEIELHYPHLKEGVLIGLLGLLAVALLYRSLWKERGKVIGYKKN